MSLKIVGSIAASVTGIGSISTGVWYKIQSKNKITPSLSAVVSSFFQTSKRATLKVPGTHIPKESIKSYKWTDDEVVLDWTADKNASTPYFLVERTSCKYGCTPNKVAKTFVLQNDVNEWIDIHKVPVVFPIYKFSDNPDSLDKLDFSKLVRLENKPNQEWQKYLVFDAAQSRITPSDAVNDYKENKSIQDFGTIEKAKNFVLTITLITDVGEYYEFYYKIINFLTPSFNLDDAIKQK